MTAERRYLREVPDALPAVADAVIRKGKISESALIATLLDLAEKQLLTLRPTTRRITSITGFVDRETHEFIVDTTRWDEFDPIEQFLVALLFTTMARSATMSLEDLKVLLRSKKRTYQQGIASWHAEIVARAITDGLLESDGHRRTSAGDELHDDCEAFRAYLDDFGRLEDDPLMHLELWGPYLVWASLFGEARATLATMRLSAVNAGGDMALAIETLAH